MPISPVPIKFQNSFENQKTFVGIKLKGQNDVGSPWSSKWGSPSGQKMRKLCSIHLAFLIGSLPGERKLYSHTSHKDWKDYQFVPFRHSSK